MPLANFSALSSVLHAELAISIHPLYPNWQHTNCDIDARIPKNLGSGTGAFLAL